MDSPRDNINLGLFNKFLSATSHKEENHEPSSLEKDDHEPSSLKEEDHEAHEPSHEAEPGQDEGDSDPKLPDEYTPYNRHEYAQYESRENDTSKLKSCCKNIGRLVK